MIKKKVYHIHTEYKFLNDSLRFEDDKFENILLIIGQVPPHSNLLFQSLFIRNNEPNLISRIFENIQDADLIVLNGLCPIKLKLLSMIDAQMKIVWRFFGYELYGKRKDLMFDSDAYQRFEISKGVFGYFKKGIRNIKRSIVNKKETELRKKIDYILLFCEEEYVFLKENWSIPEYIELNINNIPLDWEVINIKKEDIVILGNSSSPYNNHLEIFQKIYPYKKGNVQFKMFFSYGNFGEYADLVRKKGKDIDRIEFIEDFLSEKEFTSLYNSASALVINSYRQFALGNIFTALRRGVKIYLHPKNVIKDWLEKEGFLIFSVNDLLMDLENHAIRLTPEEIKINLEALQNLQIKNNQQKFTQRILEIIEN